LLLHSGVPASGLAMPTDCVWRSGSGGELWIGDRDSASSGLGGRAELIVNCANEDFDWPHGTKRFFGRRVLFAASGV